MRFVYYLRHVILNKILFDTEHLCCIFLHIKSIGYTTLICFYTFPYLKLKSIEGQN